jgi:hypothetical protein
MKRVLGIGVTTLLTMGLVGCGGSSPISPASAPFASGATVSGVVVGQSPAGASPAMFRPRAASDGAGVVVSVAGTDLHAVIDGSGRFSFVDVPAGTVTLTFSGGSANGSVSVPDVAATETIQLSVSLDGGGATIESSSRSMGGDEEIEGRVEALPPVTADGAMVVAGVTVTPDGSSTFLRNGSPASVAVLATGFRVHL